MKRFITANFSIILLLSSLLGMFLPSPGGITPILMLALLFVIVFSSFFQLDFNRQAFRENFTKAVVYSVIRFVVLPVAVYYMVLPFGNFYAFALFFLALMPGGTSSPALCALMGGNFNLSLFILVVSNVIIVATVPLLAPVYARSVLEINALSLFKTLVITIFLPFFVHLPLRRYPQVSGWMKSNMSLIVIICLSLMLMLAISRNRNLLLGNPGIALIYFGISIVFFLFLYAAGWLIGFIGKTGDHVAGSVSSGSNNIGLAISLSLLYLSPQITLLFIFGEFAWVFGLMGAKRIFKTSEMNA